MTRVVATAETAVTATVTPARTATSLRLVIRARRAPANANGTTPANHSNGSEAAFAPAMRPTPTASGHDPFRVRNTIPTPRTTAPNGVVTCAETDTRARSVNGPAITRVIAPAVTPAQRP